jgi:hypothetical protein
MKFDYELDIASTFASVMAILFGFFAIVIGLTIMVGAVLFGVSLDGYDISIMVLIWAGLLFLVAGGAGVCTAGTALLYAGIIFLIKPRINRYRHNKAKKAYTSKGRK